jgi:uncharacterized protein (DUF697 family)
MGVVALNLPEGLWAWSNMLGLVIGILFGCIVSATFGFRAGVDYATGKMARRMVNEEKLVLEAKRKRQKITLSAIKVRR